jgi:hypothetical protein
VGLFGATLANHDAVIIISCMGNPYVLIVMLLFYCAVFAVCAVTGARDLQNTRQLKRLRKKARGTNDGPRL